VDVVLNWLWQGAVVGLAAKGVLRAVPRSCTQARYAFVCAAGVVVLVLPAVPYLSASASPATAGEAASIWSGVALSLPVAWWTSTLLAIGIGCVWVAACAVRLVAGALALRETRRQCRACPSALEARLHHWSRVRRGGRRTRVVLSDRVRAAAVLGGRSPLIALAPALLERLSDADVDRVVIHEWAHVQRRDDVAQRVVLLVRAVAGWHPAMWWLERQLDLEREVACDEMAVAVTGSAKAYATCLATLAALPGGPVRTWPLLAVASPSNLRRRLIRILAGEPVVSVRPWGAAVLGPSVALAALAVAVGNIQVVEPAARSSGVPGAALAQMSKIDAIEGLAFQSDTQPVLPSSPELAHRRRAPDAGRRPLERAGPRPDPERTPGKGTVRASALPVLPLRPMRSLLDGSMPITVAAFPAPAMVVGIASSVDEQSAAGATGGQSDAEVMADTPWAAAGEAGIAIGRSSADAGLATAGLFTRFGKRLAASF
jgi:beta-lactamase regulating signal transducer with metallopeptidase domain